MKTKMNVSKKTQYRWFVLALIFCVYMVAGADRSNIGMVVPFIKKSFELTNTDIGDGQFFLSDLCSYPDSCWSFI